MNCRQTLNKITQFVSMETAAVLLALIISIISLSVSWHGQRLTNKLNVLQIRKLENDLQSLSTKVGQADGRFDIVEKTTEALKSQIRTLLKVSHVDQPPSIDGMLNEDVWSQTESLTYAVHPQSNASTTATVKLLWDAQYLYAAFDVNDTQVEGSTSTPWDGDSVSVIIDNGGQIQEYRHSLLNNMAGNIVSAYQLKGKSTFANTTDHDDGFIIEMRISWNTTQNAGNTIAADFLSVDHDQNPGGLFDDSKTIFSKISWDGDADVRTANRNIQLLAY